MQLYNMLKLSAEADKAKALLTLELLTKHAAGIGDHSNVVQAVDEQVSLIANAQDKLVALKHFD